MKSLTDQLANYAAYHRDRRNIGSHFIGIPMILFSIVLLLSKPVLMMADAFIPLTPALIASIVVGLYYLRLDRPLGLLMCIILLVMLKLSVPLALGETGPWLAWGIGFFVVGWIFQSVGHYWEGKKPAFLDDIMGLIIGPLFVTAEVIFLMGGRPALHAEIISRVGKTHIRKGKQADQR